LLRPVGSRRPRVYWTRRLVLLVVVVVVVVLLARACSGGGTASDAGSSHRPGASPTPSATTAAVGIQTCRARDLSVTASTDATTYPTDALPRLSAVVRNASNSPCRFQTAAGARIWTIVSGADQVWSSADCVLPGVVARTRLRPGHTIAYALAWNRHRSAQGCPADTAAAGPGTYQLKVTVNGVAAPTVVFHLTG
jgi:hypothetical protein